MQMKSTIGHPYTPTRKTKMKKADNLNVGVDMEQLELASLLVGV